MLIRRYRLERNSDAYNNNWCISRLMFICAWRMKKIKVHICLGLISLAAYTANRFWLKPLLTDSTDLFAIIMKNHFNDFCGSFLFCSYFIILINLTKADITFTSLKDHLILGIICAVFWEMLSPVFIKKSVPDIVDGIAYIAGSIVYFYSSTAMKKVFK